MSVLINGLKSSRLVSRGFSSSATPAGPVLAGLLTRGLGVGQRLVIRGLGGTVTELPPDLLAAIADKISQESSLSTLTTITLDKAPPDASIYCVLMSNGSTHLRSTSTSEWKDDRVTIRLYASTADEANTLGLALLQAVKGWGSLDYQDGYSIPLLRTGRRIGEVKGKRPGDPGSCYYEVTYSARCTEGP